MSQGREARKGGSTGGGCGKERPQQVFCYRAGGKIGC